jgi:hypothetical protein
MWMWSLGLVRRNRTHRLVPQLWIDHIANQQVACNYSMWQQA